MKTSVYVLAIILALAGAVFFLQGINIIPGSFMTGRPEWAVIGGISLFIGVMLLVLIRNRK